MIFIEKLKDTPIILGSQSPRRQELLRKLDLDFTVEIPQVDEHIDTTLTPEEIVSAIAAAKLTAFSDESYHDRLVIVADTLVADEHGTMLGKPADVAEAKSVLAQLSGREHAVYTGVTLALRGRVHQFVERTAVWFVELEEQEIDYYIANYNPMDKAGSYGIQEWIGRIAVERIDGAYENVMGLPTARLYRELKQFIAGDR